jgi:hypothetical protein
MDDLTRIGLIKNFIDRFNDIIFRITNTVHNVCGWKTNIPYSLLFLIELKRLCFIQIRLCSFFFNNMLHIVSKLLIAIGGLLFNYTRSICIFTPLI